MRTEQQHLEEMGIPGVRIRRRGDAAVCFIRSFRYMRRAAKREHEKTEQMCTDSLSLSLSLSQPTQWHGL
jgi:hypothetical protein